MVIDDYEVKLDGYLPCLPLANPNIKVSYDALKARYNNLYNFPKEINTDMSKMPFPSCFEQLGNGLLSTRFQNGEVEKSQTLELVSSLGR